MMSVLFRPALMAGLLVSFVAGAQTTVERDLVVYGASPAGLAAAVQAKRMGLSVVVVSPDTRIGGLTTGGLGQTDYHCVEAYGGIALEFYRDVARHYAKPESWTREKASDYTPDGQCEGSRTGDSMWTFEPSAALGILEGWVKRDGLDIRRGEYLDRQSKSGVEVEDGKIKSIKTLSGNEYRGKMFVDATYEGDLMAAAGVNYAVGRESNATYGETNNGIENRYALFHQFVKGVDPYVVKGDPSSGLLPGVEPYDPDERDGAADKRVQAYCFRLCLTDVPENRIPFKKPEGYDERDYELLFRNFEAGETAIPWINSRMPNRKTDTNNRKAFSSDFVGGNWRWPEASYAERDRIFAAHLKHQKGLMWTLANHPRVPASVREEVSRWGTCKDEFLDGPGDGWQSQLYVREARRLVGEYVVTEHDCRGARKAPRPVALAAYGMDSHNVRRRVGADGFVHNEGDVEDHRVYGEFGPHADKSSKEQQFPPYGIDYGALVPKRGECANLLVPVCVSASHMAYGSIRMEPVFFELGQVAGTAAALAIGSGSAVQDVDYAALRARLEADGQKCGAHEHRAAPADAAKANDEHAVPDYRTVRIASFKTVISPEVGAKICGYDADQVSVTKHDDLWAIGLAVDDGTSKALIVTFDLVGMDGETIRPLRRKCAQSFGVPESSVLFSCTHNHSGPESVRRFNMPQFINRPYLDFLETQLLKSVGSLKDAKWTTCRVLFNSAFPDENYNRRYLTSDNCATFVPLRREYQSLCRQHNICDKELGLLLFYEEGRVSGGDGPIFVVGNYAAHVLSSHSPALGGIRISADFPGYFRDYIKSETGADAMFIQGASGDVCPNGDEEGMGAARQTGERLARAAINAMCDADRNRMRFYMRKPTLASSIRQLKLPIRSDLRGRIQPEFDGSDEMMVEVQCLSIGDVAFAGMPGELLVEPGLEIKWNSPYRRTWIANLSTGFCGYMSPPNFMVAGGYEPLKQSFRSRGTFRLVSETVDQLFELRAQAFPEDCRDADPYPDNLTQPVVNIPEGVKYRKVKAAKRPLPRLHAIKE